MITGTVAILDRPLESVPDCPSGRHDARYCGHTWQTFEECRFKGIKSRLEAAIKEGMRWYCVSRWARLKGLYLFSFISRTVG
jgi:hypothetical protein